MRTITHVTFWVSGFGTCVAADQLLDDQRLAGPAVVFGGFAALTALSLLLIHRSTEMRSHA